MLILLGLLLGCRSEPASPPLVLLITWDTTRADALGAWARELPWHPERPTAPQQATPHADALARDGLRFSWALAPAPTTLASHASLMSGLDSHGHAVPRNGFPVPPDLPLLAESFAAAGWDSLAVVAASPLSADMGLSRGFRLYDDHFGTEVRRRVEDGADRVTDRALAAVDQRLPDRPLFLFVHYFDAHGPWDSAPDRIQARFVGDFDHRAETLGAEDAAPLVELLRHGPLTPAQSDRARGLYLAEVAWVDEQTGRLLDGLEARGLLDDALVALSSDHGEALDDPGSTPYGHGLDADLPALHVPLILKGSGRFALPRGLVVSAPVRLLDLGPTLLGLAGLAPVLGEGRDLRPSWEGGPFPELPSFAEATKPLQAERHDAWNNLAFDRSLAFEGHLLVYAPWRDPGARLYGLQAGQPPVEDPARARAMLSMLARWDAEAPPYRPPTMSAVTLQQLQSLGYQERAPPPP